MENSNKNNIWLIIISIVIIVLTVVAVFPMILNAIALIEINETEASETEIIESVTSGTETKEVVTNTTNKNKTVTTTANRSKITIFVCATVLATVGMICSVAFTSLFLKFHKQDKDCSDRMLDLFRDIYGYTETKKYKITVKDQNDVTNIFDVEVEPNK